MTPLTAVIAAVLMSAVVVIISGTENAASLAAGAAVAIASFFVLVFTVTRSMSDGSNFSKAAIAGLGFLKLGLIGVLLWWLVSKKMIEPITFLAGFSTVVIALLIEGLRSNRKA